MSLIKHLQEIEIDPIDICNRTCEFCPRSFDTFSNTKARLSFETAQKINDRLKEINYSKIVSFVGFGEPLLHKHLEECIRLVVADLTLDDVFIVTNGDFLTESRLQSLADAGVTTIKVSMYDEDLSTHFNAIAPSSLNMVYRHYYATTPQLVNRNEIWNSPKNYYIERACYIPFTSTLIDYHGNYLLCANDWSKSTHFGTVWSHSIEKAWLGSEINYFRHQLQNHQRTLFPCSACQVDGCQSGKTQFNAFNNWTL
jgi:organic radical activating enzyme